jgi:hypothetical protein
LAYFNKFGQEIWREPRGRSAGYPWPQFSIHHGKLQTTLLEKVIERIGRDKVHQGHSFKSFRQDADKVVSAFSRRAEAELWDICYYAVTQIS